MNEVQIISAFEQKLSCLKDWPDKFIIYDITKFAEEYIVYAGYFYLEIHTYLGTNWILFSYIVNMIAAKCIDPQTNITYKLPLFYLMDSIMKHVGGLETLKFIFMVFKT